MWKRYGAQMTKFFHAAPSFKCTGYIRNDEETLQTKTRYKGSSGPKSKKGKGTSQSKGKEVSEMRDGVWVENLR